MTLKGENLLKTKLSHQTSNTKNVDLRKFDLLFFIEKLEFDKIDLLMSFLNLA